MKRILTAIAAFAMLVGFASCQKDEVTKTDKDKLVEVTLQASFAEQTKFDYEENGGQLVPKWTGGENILAISGEDEKTVTKLSVKSYSLEDGTATLSGKVVPGKVHLICKSILSESDWNDGKLALNYAIQSGSVFSINGCAVMLADGEVDAQGTATSFAFANAGCIVGFYNMKPNHWEGSSLYINSVTIYGSDLSESNVTIESGVLINSRVTCASDRIVLSKGEPFVIGNKETGALSQPPIYFIVPPAAKIKRIDVKMQDNTIYTHNYGGDGITVGNSAYYKITGETTFTAAVN